MQNKANACKRIKQRSVGKLMHKYLIKSLFSGTKIYKSNQFTENKMLI